MNSFTNVQMKYNVPCPQDHFKINKKVINIAYYLLMMRINHHLSRYILQDWQLHVGKAIHYSLDNETGIFIPFSVVLFWQ